MAESEDELRSDDLQIIQRLSISSLEEAKCIPKATPSRTKPFRKRRKRTSKSDLTSALSDDILQRVFSYIPHQSWFNIMLTCKRFNLLASEVFDPTYNDDEPIRMSCMYGNTLAMHRLLRDKRVDPSTQHNFCIRFASQNGHAEVVHDLLRHPKVDPTALDHYCLIAACQYGHLDVVRELLEDGRVDPSARDSAALTWAKRGNYDEIVQELKKKMFRSSLNKDGFTESTLVRVKVSFHDNRIEHYNFSKTVELVLSMTVLEALTIIAEKINLIEILRKDFNTIVGSLSDVIQEYGLFIREAHSSDLDSPVGCWLENSTQVLQYATTLREYGIVEFRRKQRIVQVLNIDRSAVLEVPTLDCTPVKQLVSDILEVVGMHNVGEYGSSTDTSDLVALDNNVLLMHLPKANKTQFLLLNTPRKQSVVEFISTERPPTPSPLGSVGLYFLLPTKAGYLLRRRSEGVFKTWIRQWFLLKKDKLYFYKNKGDITPRGFIDIKSLQYAHAVLPFDNISKKSLCFEMKVDKGQLFLAAETMEEGREWLESLQSRLSYCGNVSGDIPEICRRKLQLQWNIDYMRLGYCPDKEPEFSTRRSSSVAYPSEEFKELDITILTKDDSLQVRIKPEKLVFDIVSDVLQQIGTNQVFICTYLDISPQRKAEMLDHQLKLSEQSVPTDAVYMIKRSGIVGDGLVPPTYCLYVQLPVMEDYLLLRQDVFFQRCWVTLRASRLFFYLDSGSRDTPCFVVPLYEATAVVPSAETEQTMYGIWRNDVHKGCGFEFVSNKGVMAQVMARNKEEKKRWILTLSKWLKFFPDDGKVMEYQPYEDIFYQNFHEFFVHNENET